MMVSHSPSHATIPQSQHTLFMRGFPADADMNEIRDYFFREGRCSFDFFKQSLDKSQLFVALRFESRDIAKRVLEKYNNTQVLGSYITIAWFRDVRRYAAYTGQAPPYATPRFQRGGFVSGMRGGMGTFRGSGMMIRSTGGDEMNGGGMPPGMRGGGQGTGYRGSGFMMRRPMGQRVVYMSHPRGFIQNVQTRYYDPVQKLRQRARAPSTMPSRRPTTYYRRSRSRTPTSSNKRTARSRSRSSERYSRSPSRSRGRKGPHTPSPTRESSKRRSRSSSNPRRARDKHSSERDSKRKRRDSPASVSSGEVSHDDESDDGRRHRKRSGSVRRNGHESDSDSSSVASEHSTKKVSKKSQRDREREAVHSGDERETHANSPTASSTATTGGKGVEAKLGSEGKAGDLGETSEEVTAEFSAIQSNTLAEVIIDKDTPLERQRKSIAMSADDSMDESPLTNGRAKKRNQRRSKDSANNELKLSQTARDASQETERQRKISQLPPDKLAKLQQKKRELEQAYKQDCETFGTVVKMLISKDPSLEERILTSLRESLKDIGQKFMQEMNQFVDQLLEDEA